MRLTIDFDEMKTISEYIQADESGALLVAETRVPLESVLSAWSLGHSPETIRSQFPSLSLEQVYGAIAWCLSHRDELEEYLKRQDELWRLWRQRSESQPSPLRERIRSARQPAGSQ